MTLDALVAICLRYVAIVGGLQLLLNIAGANIYEFRAIKRQHLYMRHPYTRHFRRRPLVTAIIVTHNDQAQIQACLSTLMASSYRNLEIIVADNASQDATRQVVRAFAAVNPQRSIRLFARRKATSQTQAARAAYQAHGRGQLVMVLHPEELIDTSAIMHAIRHTNADDAIDLLLPRRSIRTPYSSLAVLRRYQELLAYRSYKQQTIFNSSRSIDTVLIYRRAAFITLTKPTPNKTLVGPGARLRAYYADDVIVHTAAPPTLDRLLIDEYQSAIDRLRSSFALSRADFTRGIYAKIYAWLQPFLAICNGLAALILPLLIGYFLYMSVALQEPVFLVAGGALLSLLLAFAIWGDNQLKPHQKLAYTLGIPLTYGLFCAVSVIRAVAFVAMALMPGRLTAKSLF